MMAELWAVQQRVSTTVSAVSSGRIVHIKVGDGIKVVSQFCRPFLGDPEIGVRVGKGVNCRWFWELD